MTWRRAALFVGAALALTVASAASQAAPQVWSGQVTAVVDGDTLQVLGPYDAKPRPVRIVGIDAPEICQDGGLAARQALQQQVLQRRVTLVVSRQDDYGRDLATVLLDGEDVGRRLVTLGHAWSYRFRSDPGPYWREEQDAQAAGRGLFAQALPEQPRDFRRRHGSCHAPLSEPSYKRFSPG